MQREVVLVTGGNSGIGYEAARALARAGWHVVLASRNRGASAAAVARIEAESGVGSASELGLDLASLASVRQLAKEIDARGLPLRALVLNAGLQGRERRQSADGYELTFAANHLGHYLLAHRLLGRLSERAPARIVVVASGVHDPAQRTAMPHPAIGDFDALAVGEDASGRPYSGPRAYVHSKLCNVWFAYELARRLEAAGLSSAARPITVNAYDPGLVPGSGLARDYPAAARFVWDRILPGVARVLNPVYPGISTAGKSGAALARLVTDPALARVTGKYFPSTARWREAPSSVESYDAARAHALWEASARLAGLAPDESALARA
jgi:NAD(P)-dependent dehydrogenase (short-subunit alcohol dehydrogenase family)